MITFYCVGGKEQSGTTLQSVSLTSSVLPSATSDDCLGLLTSFFSTCNVQLRVFALAESLGAVESLAESPAHMTHASVPDDQRALLGIDDTLIRLSVGIESCQDLIDDLDSALNAALEK